MSQFIDGELIEFAYYFASIPEKQVMRYFSSKGKYKLDVVLELDTFARIGHTKGVMEFSLLKLNEKKYSKDFIAFIVCWLHVQFETEKTLLSDKITLLEFMPHAENKKQLTLDFISFLSDYVSELNVKRAKQIVEILKLNNNENTNQSSRKV